MEFNWKVDRSVLLAGKYCFLDNFSLWGIDVPFQAYLFFRKDGKEFSFGFQSATADFKRGEPFLHQKGLYLKLRFELLEDGVTKMVQECSEMKVCGDLLTGCKWIETDSMSPKAREFQFKLGFTHREDFWDTYMGDHLRGDLQNFFVQDNKFCDITIHFDTLEKHTGFKAHRLMLWMRCPAYHNDSFACSKETELDWTAYNQRTANCVLAYIYLGTLGGALSIPDRLQVMTLGNELQLFNFVLAQAYLVARDPLAKTEFADQVKAFATLIIGQDPVGLTPPGQTGHILLQCFRPPPPPPPPTVTIPRPTSRLGRFFSCCKC